ncbi:ScbR family autoregulator-binding transcription factor [Streptomyces sp. DB-54]
MILEAAASVFDELGFDRATIAEILARAGVTKGALYFHFPSKEDLALAVLREQVLDIAVRPQQVKLQEFVDAGQILAYRLRHDAIQRGAARLAIEQGSNHLDRKQSMSAWSSFVEGLLKEAKARGEVLESVNVRDTAELFVGAFAGLQMMSKAFSDQDDLGQRLAVFFEHTLPTIAVPAMLSRLRLDPERGAQLDAELREQGDGADGDGGEGAAEVDLPLLDAAP